ncbi:carboxylesterase, putative [Talaromyces stipitatus ATCC 10500]|uniref:Carboxylic ester hydrolase n=1 Tax=Talaromyces stipitatus (strain ATCC 10500 / CBS 375.48 / QM 6759 / NRRL 1006) TaxID=441959 RepID=B8MN92_TALSN|nr:carboxylesterase, putative [Talaromyces stipitatus ATCC 10500]EED14541.1 carboxylesterase, putative [Talaromyces stipitatus ATCC 10500]
MTTPLIVLLLSLFTLWSSYIFGHSNLVIDLGYQLNQGQTVNNSLVTFRNIRYADAPRFKPPTVPGRNRSAVQNASDIICPQGMPGWLLYGAVVPVTKENLPPVDPRTSEDCLFLDVLLPQRVWMERARTTKRAPVLVWIHGGGYTLGWKDASGRGNGLVARSEWHNQQGVILVSINYRLGLFGWMNGEGVTSNIGLLDQRLALDWVQKHIHLFGGDPDNVTILGESAGGGSVEAHLTAYGGRIVGKPLFKGAIAQSPFLVPEYPYPNSYVNSVAKYGNVSSIADLQSMSSTDLQTLNALVVGNTPVFGTFTFGVTVDGDYVPDLPGKLLQQGKFDKTVYVMTGHNGDEGSRFVPSTIVTNESSYREFLQSVFPSLADNPEKLFFITQTLYPPIFNGGQGYTTQTERNNITIGDAVQVCNTRYMNQAAFLPATYAYQFSVPPAVHGADLSYTFYDFGSAVDTDEVNATVAMILQHYITQFAATGSPNAHKLPYFPPATGGLGVQNLGSDFVGPMQDESGVRDLPERCHYWQQAPYLSRDDESHWSRP